MAALGWPVHERAAIAVSGGGDSMALMLLFAEWTHAHGASSPAVLSVDHSLRAGSAKEAALVAQQAAKIGLQAHVLRRRGARPKADIENAAREARYRLMGEWCRTHIIGALFLAHTSDDQAETFLLRLARGSGVDGLSAMQPRAPFPLGGFAAPVLLRPLLGIGRAELRAFLAARGQAWIEDPMNEDVRFARTRLRAIMPVLEAAGLSSPRIAAAAAHLARAREALEAATAALMDSAVRFAAAGYALLDADAIARAPRELGLRALGETLKAISGEAYRPRFERLEKLLDAMTAGALSGGRTLHGCRIAPPPKAFRHFGATTLLVAREARAAARAPAVLVKPGATVVWDGRFTIRAAPSAVRERLYVTALGNRPEWAEALAHLPAAARAGLPVLRRGELIAAVPHARAGAGVPATESLRVDFLGSRARVR